MDTQSERRMRILRFVGQYRTNYGYSPSVRDIGTAVDLPGSGVHYHLGVLITAGLMSRENGKPRTLRLTDAGIAAITEEAQ